MAEFYRILVKVESRGDSEEGPVFDKHLVSLPSKEEADIAVRVLQAAIRTGSKWDRCEPDSDEDPVGAAMWQKIDIMWHAYVREIVWYKRINEENLPF